MKPGWFTIPGVQQGDRSLQEQLAGLEPALADARGREVMDFGCAEGLIAFEFAKAGAVVHACDYNTPMIEIAQDLCRELPVGVRAPNFETLDLNETICARAAGALPPGQYDIVLALAIAHKLGDPQAGVEFFAECSRDLVVFRLPDYSDGEWIRGKHSGKGCNVNRTMEAKGFKLERIERGPRSEIVQYWRRCGNR